MTRIKHLLVPAMLALLAVAAIGLTSGCDRRHDFRHGSGGYYRPSRHNGHDSEGGDRGRHDGGRGGGRHDGGRGGRGRR